MSKKKRKMSPSQAAAARKEVTPNMLARERSREVGRQARLVQQKVQREQSKSPVRVIVVGSIVVALIIFFAWFLTVGPGMLIDR